MLNRDNVDRGVGIERQSRVKRERDQRQNDRGMETAGRRLGDHETGIDRSGFYYYFLKDVWTQRERERDRER